MGKLEKDLHKANLGVSPKSDGKVLRLIFPPLTEDRRKELDKVVHKMAEDGRIAVRSIRRDANEKLEIRVEERTTLLITAKQHLIREIAKHQLTLETQWTNPQPAEDI